MFRSEKSLKILVVPKDFFFSIVLEEEPDQDLLRWFRKNSRCNFQGKIDWILQFTLHLR